MSPRIYEVLVSYLACTAMRAPSEPGGVANLPACHAQAPHARHPTSTLTSNRAGLVAAIDSHHQGSDFRVQILQATCASDQAARMLAIPRATQYTHAHGGTLAHLKLS
jgi:hypothetical protein